MSAPIRLFVGNLPDKVDEHDLRNAFSKFGEITALDIKNKLSVENNKKLFAFITLSASNYDIESCIQHFTNGDFNGNRLYVTRARESFLERLQRERDQAQRKELEKNEPVINNVKLKPLNINLNTHKRKLDTNNVLKENRDEKKFKDNIRKGPHKDIPEPKIADGFLNLSDGYSGDYNKNFDKNDKQTSSDKKRLESMKRKRQEFKEKKMIIKTGLIGVDKAINKKVIFSDDDNDKTVHENGFSINDNQSNDINDNEKKRILFDDGDESDSEVNFKIKEHFEGKRGQKVLDLQSRYKADKRFILDERFIEEDKSDEEPSKQHKDEGVEIDQVDEKRKQLNILQDVLGLPFKIKQAQDNNKQTKAKLGMPRFDPTQPDHAKFLAPVVTKEQPKKEKKKDKEGHENDVVQEEQKKIEKVEVSKEKFYKVSDNLKEALVQPNSFSLRSLFGKNDNDCNEEITEQTVEHIIPQVTREKKVKNPLDPGERNPFVYDSSDSEDEGNKVVEGDVPQFNAPKPVWRENLFFSEFDSRLTDGLLYFTQNNEEKVHKDRRELKYVMKKRIYNKERKNQMFQKKIGGKRKTVKRNFRKKS